VRIIRAASRCSYNLAIRNHAGAVVYCEREGVGFIPFWPLHIEAVGQSEVLARVAAETGATP
jgi:pyridoxine 4-dehydrogenase